MSRLKKFMQILTAITAGAGLSTLIFFGAQKTMIQLPTTKEIQEATNISAQLPVEERTTLRRSRESTARDRDWETVS